MTVYSYISFLTDYGLEDGFVAACHGAAARIAPASRIIDITHLVQPGDVRRGAAVLAQTVPYLPPAVHVAVVDPGNETPMPRQPDWGGESGRGLQIVGALSHVWGWSPIAGHGKAVWAVLRDP